MVPQPSVLRHPKNLAHINYGKIQTKQNGRKLQPVTETEVKYFSGDML